jgi:hypothetical protein
LHTPEAIFFADPRLVIAFFAVIKVECAQRLAAVVLVTEILEQIVVEHKPPFLPRLSTNEMRI